jgi:phage gp29-like protein
MTRFVSAEFGESGDRPAAADLMREIATRHSAGEWWNWIGRLPDPDPVLKKLPGGGVDLLEALTADDHVISVIQTRKLGTLSREWKIEAGTPDGETVTREAEALAEDFAADLERVDVYSLVSQVLDAPLYGFVPLEILWAPANGRVRIKDIRPLPARWFGFDIDGEPRFLSKDNPWEGDRPPFGKFVFARHFPSYDNPYGLRLLSRCFWPVTFKKGGWQFWVTFAERYGMPWVVGQYPPGTNREEQDRLLASLRSMVRDAAAIYPAGGEIKLISAEGNATGQVYERLIARADAAISKAVVGQTLTADIDGKGSYAASKTHEHVLESYQDGDARLVKTVMEEIGWLYGLVNAPEAPAPAWSWFEEEDMRAERAERDQVLSQAGVRFTSVYFQRHYNLAEDEFEIGEEVAGRRSQVAGKKEIGGADFAGGSRLVAGGKEEVAGKKEEKAGEFAEGGRPQDEWQAEVDRLAEESAAKGAETFKADEERLIEIVRDAAGFDDMQERIIDAYGDLDPDALAEVLEQAILAADLYGRWTETAHGS